MRIRSFRIQFDQSQKKRVAREISPEKSVKTGLYYQGYRSQRPSVIPEKETNISLLPPETHPQLQLAPTEKHNQPEASRTTTRPPTDRTKPFDTRKKTKKPKTTLSKTILAVSRDRPKPRNQKATQKTSRRNRGESAKNRGGSNLLGENQRNRLPSKIRKNTKGMPVT